MLYALVKPSAFVLLKWVFHLRVVGAANIPREGPALIAANHTSFLDPVVVGAAAPRPLCFMAKAELFRVPLLGALIRRLNAHPVERAGADVGALRRALTLLAEAKALLVFPEGTRGREGALQPGKPGVGMLAAAAGVPVVPTYVRGTGHALPRGGRWLRRARITVAYGPPLRFERTRGRERYQEISDRIMAAIGRLKAEVEGAPLSGVVRPASFSHAASPARGLSSSSPYSRTGGT